MEHNRPQTATTEQPITCEHLKGFYEGSEGAAILTEAQWDYFWEEKSNGRPSFRGGLVLWSFCPKCGVSLERTEKPVEALPSPSEGGETGNASEALS